MRTQTPVACSYAQASTVLFFFLLFPDRPINGGAKHFKLGFLSAGRVPLDFRGGDTEAAIKVEEESVKNPFLPTGLGYSFSLFFLLELDS